MRGHAALSLDAHYLNMNINELEPLVEPWQMSGHAVKPLGLRITSGRLYSTRLLQLNLSMVTLTLPLPQPLYGAAAHPNPHPNPKP